MKMNCKQVEATVAAHRGRERFVVCSPALSHAFSVNVSGVAADQKIRARNAKIDGIVRTHQNALRRYLYRRVGNWTEAEDLASELFLRLTRRLELGDVENPQAYLFFCAGNLLKDRARRASVARVYSNELTHELEWTSEGLTPERQVEGKQTLNATLKLLDALDLKVREAFLMYRVDGIPHAIIAEHFGISTSCVRKYIGVCAARLSEGSVPQSPKAFGLGPSTEIDSRPP